MQTDIAETIYEKVKGLPLDKQEKILEFLDALDVPKKSIWDKLDDRLKDVPQEELTQLPVDASANLDHYLYGSPKNEKSFC